MGDMIEVLAGVEAGDRVVINPPTRLRDGAKIKDQREVTERRGRKKIHRRDQRI